MNRYLNGAAILAVGCASFCVTAAPASAATAVSGQVSCVNSSVSGVYIQANSSTSGFASWSMPIQLGGLSMANYSFTLNKGGSYRVKVGCGGSGKNWAVTATSSSVSGANNNFRCNDVNPALAAAGQILFRKDLTRGISYKSCKRI